MTKNIFGVWKPAFILFAIYQGIEGQATATTIATTPNLAPRSIDTHAATQRQIRIVATNYTTNLDYFVPSNLSLIKQTFAEASKFCERSEFGGRLATYMNRVRFVEATMGMPAMLQIQTPGSIQNGVYHWVFPGAYENIPVPRIKCPVLNFTYGVFSSGNISHSDCSIPRPFYCEKPQIGNPCFESTSKQLNCNAHQTCRQNGSTEFTARPTCICDPGFILKGDQCQDIDECSSGGSSRCGSSSRVQCINTIGSHVCHCRGESSWMIGGQCYYVLTLTHEVLTLDIRKINLTKLDVGYKAISSSVVGLYGGIYTPSINQTHSNYTYTVAVNYSDISPNDMIAYFDEFKRRNPSYGLKPTDFKTRPKQALLQCELQLIDTYLYDVTEVGQIAYSSTPCPNSTLPRASVRCRSRVHRDGSQSAYFDHSTIFITNCSLNIQSMVQKKEDSLEGSGYMPPITTSEKASSDLLTIDTVLSYPSGISNNTVISTETAKRAFVAVAESVKFSKVKISTDALSHSVNIVNTVATRTVSSGEIGSESFLDVTTALEDLAVMTDIAANESFTVTSNAINVLVKGYGDVVSTSKFTSSSSHYNQTYKVESHVPKSAIEKVRSQTITKSNVTNAAFISYTDKTVFPKKDNAIYKVDQILSANIGGFPVFNLTDPMWYIMQHNEKIVKSEKREIKLYQCAFWDTPSNIWSTKGCIMVPGSNPPNCTCDHMTSFAVLVQTHKLLDDFALSLITYIGCGLSIIGLSIMIIIHLYFDKLRSLQINQIHVHLCLCMLIMYAIFVAEIERGDSYKRCVTSAAFLQYFTLATWCWMCIENYTMYRKFIKVFGGLGEYYVLKCVVIAYVVPLLTVSISLIVTVGYLEKTMYTDWVSIPQDDRDTPRYPSLYISDRICWLHGNTLYFAFLVPVGIILVANYVMFAVILRSLTRTDLASQARKNKIGLKDHVFRAFVLATLLGLTWAFAIPLTATDNDETNLLFGWLFSITNALQGFFVFVLFCIKRDDVRVLWLDSMLIAMKIKKRKTKEGGSQPRSTSEANDSTLHMQTKTISTAVTNT